MHDLTPAQNFVAHASGTRVHTETYMIAELRSAHPDQQVISVSPQPLSSCEAALLKYADETGEATYNAVAADDLTFGPLFTTHQYIPPKRRIDAGSDGKIGEKVKFGRYEYSYKGQVYLLYICEGREGNFMTNERIHQFLVHEKTTQAANDVSKLITAVGQWASELHEEIWVFDQGRWTKDKGLWKGVEKSHWKNVILDQERKSAIQEDARLFFDNKERYEKLHVPWKRGVIYHGPPGNGKTISIKALSNEMYHRKDPVATLYVKSFETNMGPERGIKAIFDKARAEAPCLLVLEDLDSLITDKVRSYFLNEVDGIMTNEGVMMVGSTNHLDRLDPGIAKRPSRFDRKFDFPRPDLDQRTTYCEYWRAKLADSEDIEFPEGLSPKIAKITNEFSFAYMQEVFIASVRTIAFRNGSSQREPGSKADSLDDVVLWKEIQRQVQHLRDELGGEQSS